MESLHLSLQEPLSQTREATETMEEFEKQKEESNLSPASPETVTKIEIDDPKTDTDYNHILPNDPFESPSSPIHRNESLTHENLFLLDNSLSLTDNGQEGDDASNKDRREGKIENTTIDLNNESYISFPSSGTHSRANSVVSSAILSTSTSLTNGTTQSKRRRPRPWDNYNAKENSSTSGTSAAAASSSMVSGETTPLLSSKYESKSIHSVKTAKRSNAAFPKGRKTIQNDDYNGEENAEYFNGKSNHSPPPRHHEESYGSIGQNGGVNNGNSNGNGYGYSTPTNVHHHGHNYKSSPSMQSILASLPIANFATVLTVLQFILMALYNIFLHYQSHRLHVQPPYAFWFSAAGRIYNSGFGPNVPTLILFGAFHPILVWNGQWWRMGSGLFCCTSLVEFVMNVWWLRVLTGMEDEKIRRGAGGGAWVIGLVYFLSGLFGGLVCIASSSSADIIYPTGLTGAGIAGCMMTIMIHRHYGNASSFKGNEDYAHRQNRSRWSFRNIELTHVAVLLEVLCGYYLPYTNFHSIIAGAMVGTCCGFFFISSASLYNQDWDEEGDSQTSSMASDLEEAFSPRMNTPPRYMYGFDDSPPPPPSSSSKGATPVMRRSILTSPDEEDEYDLVHSLNTSGGKGLKQRNVKSAQKAAYRNSLSDDDSDGRNKEYKAARKSGDFCTEPRMRFLGLFSALVLLSLTVLYIGFLFDLPSEQTISDSLYGCKTVHGLYEYTADETDDGQNQGEQGEAAASEGDTICGEICIPFSIYDQVMNNAGDMMSSKGTCSMSSFGCSYSSDAFDVGFFEIERDLYTKNCAQSQN